MHPTDQPLKNQKIQAEDVAYAAFHNTVCDVQEELTKYGEDAVLADAKLQTVLHELDVLRNSIDASYNTLLDAAVSPISSRLRRSKANVEIRITDLKNLLTSNATHFTKDQRELCGTSDESQVIVEATECDDDSIQIDDADVQSSNTPVFSLTVIMLLAVVIDSKQPCSMKPDPIDDLIVEPDKDLQKEQYPVPGFITEHTLNYADMSMIMMCIVDCSATEADDHVYESRVTNGLKHRWRWKQYELLYSVDPDTDLRTMI